MGFVPEAIAWLGGGGLEMRRAGLAAAVVLKREVSSRDAKRGDQGALGSTPGALDESQQGLLLPPPEPPVAPRAPEI